MIATHDLKRLRLKIEGRLSALAPRQHAAEAVCKSAGEMHKLQQALNRMDRQEYGFCLTCGDGIPAKRLAADPATPNCLHCAIKGG